MLNCEPCMTAPRKPPKYAKGLSEVAERISEKFNIQCSKEYIYRWLRRSPEYPVPFPSPGVRSTKFLVEECFEWIEKYYIPKRDKKGEELFKEAAEAEARHKIRKDKQHAWEFDVAKGKYITKDEHNAILSGLGSQTWGIVCEAIERGLIEKMEQNLTAFDVPYGTKALIVERAKKDHLLMVDEMQKAFAETVEAKKEVIPHVESA